MTAAPLQRGGVGARRPGNQALALLLVVSFIAGCATTKPAGLQQEMALLLPEPDKLYMCAATLQVGEATREFLLPASSADDGSFVRLGDALNKQLEKTLWRDSMAASSGRPLSVIAVGIDSGTGVYRDPRNGDTLVQVSLQFQIFKPTGQSYMDVVTGRSSNRDIGAAVAEATTQALHRLEGIVSSAGVCRPMQ